VKAFFTCLIPGDATKKRAENYALAVESFSPIAHACADAGASIAIEGWPGSAPHYANLGCTPETVRSFLKDVGRGVGVNYDPSHLIRLGVDHLRFLNEFAPHVKHVHAKDTQLDAEALYEFGTQPSAFAKPHGFGEWTWRYTLPGLGAANWNQIMTTLKSSGYHGAISIELEDENFNGTEEGEKKALLQSRDFLSGI
jgi:sugar phosphate isomerase/epimerase